MHTAWAGFYCVILLLATEATNITATQSLHAKSFQNPKASVMCLLSHNSSTQLHCTKGAELPVSSPRRAGLSCNSSSSTTNETIYPDDRATRLLLRWWSHARPRSLRRRAVRCLERRRCALAGQGSSGCQVADGLRPRSADHGWGVLHHTVASPVAGRRHIKATDCLPSLRSRSSCSRSYDRTRTCRT